MVELNKTRFLIFVSLMIFSAHAFDMIISGAHQDFKQKSETKTVILHGEKIYCGTVNPLTYEAGVNISKVIVYIINRSRYVEIVRNVVSDIRLRIASELKHWNCELVFLGIENFDDHEHNLIGMLIHEKIQPHPDQRDKGLTIEVIGENRFDRSYKSSVVVFEKYRENVQICGGNLSGRLSSIRYGALRPFGNNKKAIKLCVYESNGFYSKVDEVTWSVHVVNNTYSPEVNLSYPEYNFRIMHRNQRISLLVLGGKEYSEVTNLKRSSQERTQMREIQEEMAKNNEVSYIMGAFNFDWTEVYLVTQIILKHSEGLRSSAYNVFACGFGMFNTYYLNWYEEDGRHILQPQNSNVFDIIKVSIGKEVKERVIKMYYFDNEWKGSKIPIRLGNGRYIPSRELNDYTFPWLNQSIAFIVYDQTEVNNPIDHLTLQHCVEELGRNDIFVVMIEAINFEFYDAHIIAEWIEKHRGHINPEQIAVLGAGTFDTIFQSQRTTFNTYLNIGKNELKSIRNAFVERGNEKRILVAKIDNATSEVWTYPMNTVVNGAYETDLIPDKNMFDTTNRTSILFIITSAYNVQQIAAVKKMGSVALRFRNSIKNQFPKSYWSVFLVGLDNFAERDSHLFAELVNMQTHDERPLAEFVRVISFIIKHAEYRYKDTEPFTTDSQVIMQSRWTCLFGDYLSDGTRFH